MVYAPACLTRTPHDTHSHTRVHTGVVKHSVVMPNAPGGPVRMTCNGDYLAAVSADHKAHVFKVAGREPKAHMGPGGIFV
jgi:hypothetical protein